MSVCDEVPVWAQGMPAEVTIRRRRGSRWLIAVTFPEGVPMPAEAVWQVRDSSGDLVADLAVEITGRLVVASLEIAETVDVPVGDHVHELQWVDASGWAPLRGVFTVVDRVAEVEVVDEGGS